jgi:peptidoglycan/LPS O-acetylase OafA/YrhL
MTYRKDLGGLRGLAVLLVLGFHGKLAMIPSGFIGVDVFFVISGFLITSMIRSSLREGRFSIREFYVRRLWRLQPALLVMVLAVLMFASLFYLPDDYGSFFKSAIGTLDFSANDYFARSTTSYAATTSDVLPLLHAWSLSVEWQWYLLMPAVMYGASRLASPKVTDGLIAAMAVAWAAAAVYLSGRLGSRAYYFFLPRVFEFLLGACLTTAWAGQARRLPAVVDVLGVVSLAGLLLIAGSRGIIDGYPGAWALVVCAATAAVILAGAHPRAWVARVLAVPPLLFLGEISYSLYLWHWPVFAFARYLGVGGGGGEVAACFVLSLLAGFCSYRLVEEPWRRTRAGLLRSAMLLVVVPVVLVATLHGVARRYDFFPARFGSTFAGIQARLKQASPRMRNRCMLSGPGSQLGDADRCRLGSDAPSSRALLIGDSYANQSWNFIDVLSRRARLSVTALSTPSCLALPGIRMDGWGPKFGDQYRACLKHTGEYYQMIRAGNYRYVILGENWNYYDPRHIVGQAGEAKSVERGRARLDGAIHEALREVLAAGAVPVVIASPAKIPDDYQDCFYRRFKWRQPHLPDSCEVKRVSDGDELWFDSLFARLRRDFPSLVVIDPKDVQCDGASCAASIDGVPVYRDVGHLTDYASRRLGELYGHKYPDVLTP